MAPTEHCTSSVTLSDLKSIQDLWTLSLKGLGKGSLEEVFPKGN